MDDSTNTDQANSQQAAFMAAIDAALEPIGRMAAAPAPMNTAQLATVKAAIRQALAVMVYGPPEVPDADQVRVEDPKAEEAQMAKTGNRFG